MNFRGSKATISSDMETLFCSSFNVALDIVARHTFIVTTAGWLHCTVVERRSLAGKPSLSHARLAADG